MIIYKSTVEGFKETCFSRSISEVVEQAFVKSTGHRVSSAEVNAWGSSLQQIAIALNRSEVPGDSGVAIEYTIPQSSKRVDFILTGYNESRKPTMVIVELKQWSEAKLTQKDGIVLARRGGRAETEGPHPSYQVWSYASLLKSFNEAVYQSDIVLQPCVYMHNHPEGGAIADPFYHEHIERAPLFFKGDAERDRLRHFLVKHVRYGDAAKVIEMVEGGRIRPSAALADSLASMIKGNKEFVLIDDQKVVYEAALAAASAASELKKHVMIVEGGPGTGKSVVGINLLVELTNRRLVTKYVSKNSAPREVYAAKLSGTLRKGLISNLFSGSGAFIDTDPNVFDALVVDEAHRLNEKSGLYGNLGDNQIKELIISSKFTVFFIDESQRVTMSDIGRVAEIERIAKLMGAEVSKYELASQFRCGGSDGYLAWVDDVLEIRETANNTLDTREYDFRVVDSATELHDLIYERNENNKSRVVAGYCWEWKSKKDSKAFDIALDGGRYQRRWNLSKDGSLWIISPESVEEVGCIHTCQGLEVDYIGVIIGPDLTFEDGRIETNYRARAKADRAKSLKGIEGIKKEDPDRAQQIADEIIKNTYRTLMTRGMKGCFVYCTDKLLADHLRSRLSTPPR